MGSENDGDKELEKLKFLWEEFKYRHELCWKIIFQTTAAFVVLSVVPYVQIEVVKVLGRWIITMPLLALMTVLFAFKVLRNETETLLIVKENLRRMQRVSGVININEALEVRRKKKLVSKIMGKILEPLKKLMRGKGDSNGKGILDWINFERLVVVYFVSLLALTAGNIYSTYCIWVPRIEEKVEKEKNENSNTGQSQKEGWLMDKTK